MYFEDYGDEKEAMRLYGAAREERLACAPRAARRALGACPIGVPIQERMSGAHELLSLV